MTIPLTAFVTANVASWLPAPADTPVLPPHWKPVFLPPSAPTRVATTSHSVWQLAWPDVEAVARLLKRTTQLNVSIVGGVIYLDNGEDSTSLEPQPLHSAE